jgi:hypothetical protein
MDNLILNPGRFFRVVIRKQSYINLIYLFASFPLGILYFVFLVSGLSIGISLTIIWVGIPILLLVVITWIGLALFERFLAVQLLKEKIPTIEISLMDDADIWIRLKRGITNPITWKSLFYLFMKFPLGLFTFIVLVTVVALTLSLVAMPILYEFMPYPQFGVSLGGDLPDWQIDSMGDALVAALIGIMLWPVTLNISDGLAWIHAKFARVMLSNESVAGIFSTVARA